MKPGKNKYLIAVVVFIAVLITTFIRNNNGKQEKEKNRQEQRDNRTDNKRDNDPARRDPSKPPSDEPNRREGFNRRTEKLIFTKHARCRMGCRHIDEAEVRDILLNGRINDRKSEPAARPDPKYALEGKTKDGQEVRIIFAPSDRGMVVITVIDLDTEWPCDCK
ncbi:DUF4258 domain-containing protein [Pseudobacter ginsenosidimutans]|uniref:Uncharacterized protein DUF4258 n=1 Tax=Pseudobacter ginsenosidimutans TaxID=661488 RepID=A0A4Q7N2U5_9BACT|nr:DUF4258 domain-containing protein [Pseudobacter ginsenosidimutans]QEC43910.1 DUF4258 domain-containing protein [Pseudobacter ginsenosidimutans]RZS75339.1 uncharacterized protein DUF4258 [Pseudobacter ginsenosidimutans]